MRRSAHEVAWTANVAQINLQLLRYSDNFDRIALLGRKHTRACGCCSLHDAQQNAHDSKPPPKRALLHHFKASLVWKMLEYWQNCQLNTRTGLCAMSETINPRLRGTPKGNVTSKHGATKYIPRPTLQDYKTADTTRQNYSTGHITRLKLCIYSSHGVDN